MKTFMNGVRVRVTCSKHPLTGKTGAVVRLRRGDDGAWVRMDEDLPPEARAFPAGDDRARHAMLYPDECEAVL